MLGTGGLTVLGAFMLIVLCMIGAVAAEFSAPLQPESQPMLEQARMMCRPQKIFCLRGTRYACNRCVPDYLCRPQKVMCRTGYVYTCNACYPR